MKEEPGKKQIILIRGVGVTDFENKANAAMKEGYEPVGSISHSWFGGTYCQTMVLKANTHENKT